MTSASSTTSLSIQVVCGSRTATPASWCSPDDAVAQHAGEVGELGAVVARRASRRRRRDLRVHRQPGGAVQADDVGEVLLALGVVGADVGERLAQSGPVEGVDAGRDLVDRARRVVGVLVLDDRRDALGRRAPPGRSPSGRRTRAVSSVVAALASWCVASSSCSVAAVSSGASPGTTTTVPSTSLRVSRATRTACPVPSCVSWTTALALPGQAGGDLVPAVADDDQQVLRVERLRGGEDVAEHRAAGERVQDLGGGAAHPGALARGQDDHGCGSVGSRTARGSQLLERIVRGSAGDQPGKRAAYRRQLGTRAGSPVHHGRPNLLRPQDSNPDPEDKRPCAASYTKAECVTASRTTTSLPHCPARVGLARRRCLARCPRSPGTAAGLRARR